MINKIVILIILGMTAYVVSISEALANYSLAQKINIEVNNTFKYVKDIDNYGRPDYWATPSEFEYKGTGDCEDYAIYKYFKLLEYGVDKDLLRFVVGKSKSTGNYHLVLLYSDLILDNNVDRLRTIGDFRKNYEISYSFDEYDYTEVLGISPNRYKFKRAVINWGKRNT